MLDIIVQDQDGQNNNNINMLDGTTVENKGKLPYSILS